MGLIMNYKVKNGYILVKPAAFESNFQSGIIAVGPDQDLGTVVFFEVAKPFNDEYLLVAIEDVKVFILPEKKDEVIASE